jgi:hypothetical protein
MRYWLSGPRILNGLVFITAFALCGVTNAKADQLPKFSQFPARKYNRGPTGRVDLSDPHAYSYRTRLREGAQQGANFAGHYRVVTWGCGTDCATGAIIDALTGHVVFLPSVDSYQMEHERDSDFNSFVFRLDSRLIVFAGQLNDQGEKATFFMDFDGKNFRQVYRVIDRGAAEEPQAVEAPTNPGNTPTVRTPVPEQPATVPPTPPVGSSGTARRDDNTDEAAFVSAINDARSEYNNGSNDMAKGAARVHRREHLCQLIQNMAVRGWTGTIAKLSSSSSGKGVLAVTIGPKITIGTTNNEFSDSINHTLLSPSSNVFQQVVSLSKDQRIVFSGSFLPGDTDCVQETSLTQEGSMTDPEFQFLFTDVRAQ